MRVVQQAGCERNATRDGFGWESTGLGVVVECSHRRGAYRGHTQWTVESSAEQFEREICVWAFVHAS